MNGATLADEYVRWLREQIRTDAVGEWVSIMTPFLDRHNDLMQIYVKREGDKYLLTDDGYTLGDLEDSGCTIDTPKRKELLTATLNGFGVSSENGALIARATANTFAEFKHSLVQAMLAVNDLFYLAQAHVVTFFLEDVQRWLDDRDIAYVARVNFPGETAYRHRFDFVLPKTKRRPERLVRAVNTPSRNTVLAFGQAWHDIRVSRPKNAQAVAIVNDAERSVDSRAVDALAKQEITPWLWTERERLIQELTA